MKNIQVYAILLFVMLWWGLNVTMLKVLTAHLDPLIMQSVRITLAGITIFLLLFLFRQKLYENHMPWKSIFIAIFFGVVCQLQYVPCVLLSSCSRQFRGPHQRGERI